MMNEIAKTKIIESYANTVWNEKKLDIVDELFAEDATIHSPLGTLRGPRAMRDIIEVWLTAFPDLKVDHEAFIAQGDRVVSQWSTTGTHLGRFKGVEATGQKVSYTGASIYRVVDGKIVDYWAYVNLHQLLDSLTSSLVQPTA